MSESIQHLIDANAPMVFTYAHSRPEVQRIVYPVGIVDDVVHTIDTETGKTKKFKLDGIIFPPYKPTSEYLSYAIKNGLTISFNYRKSHPELKRLGIPIKISKSGKSVLLRIEEYFPYKRWANQKPNSVVYKYFTISAMKNLKTEHYFETLPERTFDDDDSFNFPEWIMNTDWSQGLEDDKSKEELEVVDLGDFSEYLRGDGVLGPVSDDETECETTDEEYLPSDDEVKKEAAKIKRNLEDNKELGKVVKKMKLESCVGCKYNIYNQEAHYGGCIDSEEEY